MEPTQPRKPNEGTKNRKALVVDTSVTDLGPVSSEGSSARFTPSPYDVRYFPRDERPHTPVQIQDNVESDLSQKSAATPADGIAHSGIMMESFGPPDATGLSIVPYPRPPFDNQNADSAYGSVGSAASRPLGRTGGSLHQRGLSMPGSLMMRDGYHRRLDSPLYNGQQRESPLPTEMFPSVAFHDPTATAVPPFPAPLWHQDAVPELRVGGKGVPNCLPGVARGFENADDPFWAPQADETEMFSAVIDEDNSFREGFAHAENPERQTSFHMPHLLAALPALLESCPPEDNTSSHSATKGHVASRSADLALKRSEVQPALPRAGRSTSLLQPMTTLPISPEITPKSGRSLSASGFTPMRACLAKDEGQQDNLTAAVKPVTFGHLCCSAKFSTRYKGMHTIKNASNDTLPDRYNCSVWITNLPENVTYTELLESVGRRGRIYCSFINNPDGVKFHTAAAKVVFFAPGPAQRLRDEAAHPGFFVRGHRTRITLNRIKSGEVHVSGRQCRVLIITGRDEFVNEQTLREWFDRRIVWQGDGVHELIHARGRRVLEWRFGSYRNQAEMAKLALEKDRPAGLEHVEFGFDPNEVGVEDMTAYSVAAERIQGRF
ncbi:hypothetical protein O9K51_00222 [Purpureocillium lavendulum]|uniref:RRM domain-containing protein n=1 Tax=Purpureocillium lavendulum TaxID=1247861 RepID=A0AB34G3Q8_9HYPO|nr:hypothetical protein O9K51_00222 [Purpureocillium lavendulum]